MITIRQSFHDLGNKLNVLITGCGAVKARAEDYLKDLGFAINAGPNGLEIEKPKKIEGLSKELCDILTNAVISLDQIERETLKANDILVNIHDRVYAVIDPDTGEVKNGK